MAYYARAAWHGENPFEAVRERERKLTEVASRSEHEVNSKWNRSDLEEESE